MEVRCVCNVRLVQMDEMGDCKHISLPLNVRQPFLPPAYVVRGKVIFILGNVCLFTIAGGGRGYSILGLGGTPSQVWWQGEGGVPHPRSSQGGTPSQVWSGVPWVPPSARVPHPRSRGLPHLRSTPDLGWGAPKTWMGYPPQTWEGVPLPPPRTWDWVPPRPGTGYPPDLGLGTPPDLGQGTPPPEHLIRGGRYASCVHAGELSFFVAIQNIQFPRHL